ncbi:glucosamine---fructose-6-phosphate aminotransferase (isomerizing) [Thermoflexales bacterium]|nr:glucosamine---fructose-6-phosphate aminotransferase (isomerizing) [Thermoflexales bacterium]
MCGIVGYVGVRDATPIVYDGLKRLEYRGYDSAGIAVIHKDHIEVRREAGKLDALRDLLSTQPLTGSIGIGHTRWATHGQANQINAHPHLDCTGDLVVIHNGIVENFLELRGDLQAQGHTFRSETDTETIVHLVEQNMRDGLGFEEAARQALGRLQGSQAVVLMNKCQPDRLIAARIGNAGGVTIGLGDGEMFLASDMPAILDYTRKVIFLESRQMAIVLKDGYQIISLDDGERVEASVHTISYDPASAAKGEYRHFMQKEIFEQGRSLTDTIRGRADFERGVIELPEMNLTAQSARAISRIVIAACGTSYHAGLVGRYMIEQLARIPVEVDIASEFRYRNPVIDPTVALLTITQSGETVDTLAAMEQADAAGCPLWTITNVIGSQAHRVSDGAILIHAGPEIGVASTKTFTGSQVDMYMLGLYLAQLRGVLDPVHVRHLVDDLARLPDLIGHMFDRAGEVEHLANEFQRYTNFLFLGRGINYPIALEGALKLKEISYIHAEGYAAGEMKHGPIALIDENMPVVCLAPKDAVYDKMISQIEQAKARNAIVIAVATEGDLAIKRKADHVIYVPPVPPLLLPVVLSIPLQMLAYYIAVRRGADVDQPRNLAKSVTVE